jgi:predicted metalloprotease with PDZ domain
MKLLRLILFLIYFGILTISSSGSNAILPLENIRYSFVVSMENPGTHYFHVEMTCPDQKTDFIDLKMPVWTPGYYKVQNLAKNVVNFKASNDQGVPLGFSKTLKNTWRVITKNQKTVVVSYDVYANNLFVAESYLDVNQAFISPSGVFMFPEGQIKQASQVLLKPYKGWKSISTGLDVVQGKPNTYYASNFDVLFDCPILLGNQQIINFSVKGVPHSLTVSEKDTLDKTCFIKDLTKIVETTTSLMGDIPYKHYAFITIGSPGGGLEHSNSCSLSCSGSVCDTSNMKEYGRWLTFVTHEYFHNYNVKSIRPIALGPFDYDKECYTKMLWVSEGFTVYYEYLILNRAGLLNRNECFDFLSKDIIGYENRPGHLMESATLSGFDAWIHFFDPSSDDRNNTISYYDKGCALGLFLDLKIRNATQNHKSLDDVMRGLYNKYFRELKRGFTDEEFRTMCEQTAGVSLSEIFEYASTVKKIDYPKYLALAGLSIDTTAHVSNEKVYLGASFRMQGNDCVLYNVERNSPAWNSGLGNDDQILIIEGQKAGKDLLAYILKSKKAGETIHLLVQTRDMKRNVEVVLAPLQEKTFKIEQQTGASAQQNSLLESWLK